MLRMVQKQIPGLRMLPRLPLVAVVGATGTGKSQLAVALAQRFDGEIINGDALQMYEGLPIITNKIAIEERKGIQHHLLGCVSLEDEAWTVTQFVERACVIIEEIRSRNRIPILVGGTHYYTQSLLFRDAVIGKQYEFMDDGKQERDWSILNAATPEMLKELYRVDPVMAKRWHPNDRRKIRRSLEVYLMTGRKASAIYEQQRQPPMGNNTQDLNGKSNEFELGSTTETGPPLRYDTLIFWVHANKELLHPRLDKRVEQMISEGLFEEVSSMHNLVRDRKCQGKSPDQTKGIWIAIGLKEILSSIPGNKWTEDAKKGAIEKIQIATRQYANRQFRWIRLKLQRALMNSGLTHSMFLLDGSDISQWSRLVQAEALSITERFLAGDSLPKPASLSATAMDQLVTSGGAKQSARLCEACNKTLMSEKEWLSHLKSKGHQSTVRPRIDWRKRYPKDNSS